MKFHLKLISYSGNDYCYHMVESSTGVLTVHMHSVSGTSGITGPGMWMSKAIFALSGAWRKADLTRQSRLKKGYCILSGYHLPELRKGC